MMTVGDLKKILAPLPDHVWIVLKGRGPLAETWTELGAGEPFIVLQDREQAAIDDRENAR